jgi:hypothetical protein
MRQTETMSSAAKRILILACLLSTGCSSISRNPASDSAAAATGQIGECGIPGSDGIAGQMNADELYPNYPLCNVASIITSANDSKKLNEFLKAGCRIDVPAMPGSANALWDLAVAKQRIDLIKIVLSNSDLVAQVNLYDPIDSKALKKSEILVPLNSFEVAVYGKTLRAIEPAAVPAKLKDLDVSGQQVAMLNLLLAASTDKEKLETAVKNSLRDLTGPPSASSCNQAAVNAITGRLKELSN